MALPAVLLVFAVLLSFPGLDNRSLWDDEAETALLAKNVLRFGAPVFRDGRDRTAFDSARREGREISSTSSSREGMLALMVSA